MKPQRGGKERDRLSNEIEGWCSYLTQEIEAAERWNQERQRTRASLEQTGFLEPESVSCNRPGFLEVINNKVPLMQSIEEVARKEVFWNRISLEEKMKVRRDALMQLTCFGWVFEAEAERL